MVPIAKLFQELIHNWLYTLHNEATTLLFNDSLLPVLIIKVLLVVVYAPRGLYIDTEDCQH